MQPTAGRQRDGDDDLGPLTVSRMCLGTMLMGAATPRDESHRMLDRFRDAGGTFIDTADTYVNGGSEETLAPWLARHRDEVVLATKVRFGTSDPPGEGLAPERIAAACDASLRRLGTDVIDLYQVHAPDPATPLEDSLEALDGLVRAGKVRALGASNFPAWLLAWAVALQDREGWAPFVSLQPQYSLVERSVELDLLPFCRAAGLGVLPWGPLGAGFLSGRYKRDEAPPEGSRIAIAADDIEEAWDRRATERNFRVVDAAEAIAADHGATVPQVAIAWLMARRRDRADPRRTHARAARGRARRRRADLERGGARPAGGARAAAAALPAPDADRAGRAQRLRNAGPPDRLTTVRAERRRRHDRQRDQQRLAGAGGAEHRGHRQAHRERTRDRDEEGVAPADARRQRGPRPGGAAAAPASAIGSRPAATSSPPVRPPATRASTSPAMNTAARLASAATASPCACPAVIAPGRSRRPRRPQPGEVGLGARAEDGVADAAPAVHDEVDRAHRRAVGLHVGRLDAAREPRAGHPRVALVHQPVVRALEPVSAFRTSTPAPKSPGDAVLRATASCPGQAGGLRRRGEQRELAPLLRGERRAVEAAGHGDRPARPAQRREAVRDGQGAGGTARPARRAPARRCRSRRAARGRRASRSARAAVGPRERLPSRGRRCRSRRALVAAAELRRAAGDDEVDVVASVVLS